MWRLQPIFTAYLLELEGTNKFYAGSTLTSELKKRFQCHVDGEGSFWTAAHRPIRIIRTWDGLTSQQGFEKEQLLTETLIEKFQNLEACRGGRWNFPKNSTWWVPPRLRHLVVEKSPT